MAKIMDHIMDTAQQIRERNELKAYAMEDIAMTQQMYEQMEYARAHEATFGDTRYNNPKTPPKTSNEVVEETIMNTEIYRRARLAILKAQFLTGESRTAIMEAQIKQVAYGLDKYPEPLNPNTWTVGETVEHIMDESIDRLHYLIMLLIKLEQQMVSGAFNDVIELKNLHSRMASINQMINRSIEELNYLITLAIATDRETEAAPNPDMMDSVRYACATMKNIGLSMGGADMDGDHIYVDDRTITVHPSGVKVTSDELRVFTDDELKELAAGRNESDNS